MAKRAPQITRLTDLEVNEVSIVDRAAIKRKFLLVKGEGENMAGKKVEMDADGNLKSSASGDEEAKTIGDSFAAIAEGLAPIEKKLSIPGDIRTDLFRSLREVMDRIHSVMGAADVACVDPDVGGSTLTPVLAAELSEVSKLLGAFSKKLNTVSKNDDPDTEDDTDAGDVAKADDLPDTAFLYVKEGGKKDSTGKTEPRTNRMFQVRNADGSLDPEKVRGAMSAIPKSDLPKEVKSGLMDKARKLLSSGGGQKTKKAEELLEALIEDVEKRGAKMSQKRKARFQDALKTLTSILSELDDGIEKQALEKRFSGLVDRVEALASENAKLKSDLRKAQYRVPPSNVAPTNEPPAKTTSDDDDVSWPMDMNSRGSVDSSAASLEH